MLDQRGHGEGGIGADLQEHPPEFDLAVGMCALDDLGQVGRDLVDVQLGGGPRPHRIRVPGFIKDAKHADLDRLQLQAG